VVDPISIDGNSDAEITAVFRHQQILGGGMHRSLWDHCTVVVDGLETARVGEAVMIGFLEEMIARLFGQRQTQPIRVRADDEKSDDQMLKGRK
jgi:hypothetical protein